MKGGNTFWIIWGGVLVLWLVLRYFAKQRMHPVPGMETETYKKAQLYSVFGTTATFMFALVLATILPMQGFAGRVALAVLLGCRSRKPRCRRSGPAPSAENRSPCRPAFSGSS
mgnify:CR=1 FL=1